MPCRIFACDLPRNAARFPPVNPNRSLVRLLAAAALLLGITGVTPLSADPPPSVATENSVLVPGAFGRMRRVDSTTLTLPDAFRQLRAQQQRERRSAERQARSQAREMQEGEADAGRRMEMDAALQTTAPPAATAGEEEASMTPSVSEPEAPQSGESDAEPQEDAAAAAESSEQPAEQSSEQSSEQPVEQPAEQSSEQPAEQAAESPQG